MLPYPLPIAPDLFDRMVDYGGYTYAQFFEPDSPTPLPLFPPSAARPGDPCPCPACYSGGQYPVSPVCRFWRATCEVCDGRRVYRYQRAYRYRRPRWWDRWATSSGACVLCEAEWHLARGWFSYCLLDPRGAADMLRYRAASRQVAHLTAAASGNP
jgi:hypothetical protein